MEKFQGRRLIPSLYNEKVYLVNTNDSYQDPCVLKFIECIDHSHATALLDDFNKINNCRYHSILGYRDMFLHWDPSESALYVALASDYQRGGTLQQYLSQENGTAVPESKARRWMAQLLDAVLTIHSVADFSHNNIKSSNVYLGDSDNILLGDSLPANALYYRKNRQVQADKNYTTPQLLIGQMEDTRSIGRIVLEMASSSFDDISKVTYSAEMLEAVRLLFDTNLPLEKIISQNIFLTTCLQAIGSRHAPSTALQTWPHARIRVPIELGVPGILSYMDSHRNYSDCLQAAIAELTQIFIKSPHSLATVDTSLLLSVLDSAAASPDVQITTFRFLTKLRHNIDPAIFVRILSDTLFGYATRIFTSNNEHPDVLSAVADFFSALAEDSRVAHRLVGNGLVPILTEGLTKRLARSDVNEHQVVLADICQTLFRLAVADNLAEAGLKSDLLSQLVSCLKLQDMTLKRNVLASMTPLSMEEKSPQIFLETRAFEQVAITLCQHYNDPEITKLACTILSSLVAQSPECALSLLLLPPSELPDEESGILGVVLNAYHAHADHGHVVEACAQIMAAFSCHADVVAEFSNCKNAKETVDEIARRYRDRSTIVDACNSMKSALTRQTQVGN